MNIIFLLRLLRISSAFDYSDAWSKMNSVKASKAENLLRIALLLLPRYLLKSIAIYWSSSFFKSAYLELAMVVLDLSYNQG